MFEERYEHRSFETKLLRKGSESFRALSASCWEIQLISLLGTFPIISVYLVVNLLRHFFGEASVHSYIRVHERSDDTRDTL